MESIKLEHIHAVAPLLKEDGITILIFNHAGLSYEMPQTLSMEKTAA